MVKVIEKAPQTTAAAAKPQTKPSAAPQTEQQAEKRFNMKVQFVNTNHTTKFSMTVGEIYIRKDGQATAYAVGTKEPFASREEATRYVMDKIAEFCEYNGFGVEFKDATPTE